ncbi:MAG: ornithine carbamoyltransferase, partial [Clostridia bacterium]|nr:ornithine carbamoyltransferase [Clostridia bacterium]
NGLTNESHPTQILADLLTIQEKFGSVEGKTLAYYGDARYNMGNSLMVGAVKMGMNFTACCPQKYFPDASLIEKCREIAKETGSVLTFTEDPNEGSKNADVVYTDVWVSMGEPAEVWETRIRDLSPYKVTAAVMKNAKKDAVFMHCLPAFHDLETEVGKEIYEKFGLTDMEVTDEVFLGKQSVVFDEAENRMHTIKAVMYATLLPPQK